MMWAEQPTPNRRIAAPASESDRNGGRSPRCQSGSCMAMAAAAPTPSATKDDWSCDALSASGCARRFLSSVFTVGWSAPSSYSSWPITGLGRSVHWPLSAN